MSEENPTNRRSIGEIVERISSNLADLIKGEIKLLVTTTTTSAKRYGVAGAFFAVAGILALFALPLLLWTIVYAFAYVLPMWAATLVVALLVFVVAGVCAWLGLRMVKKAAEAHPSPDSIKKTIQAAKEGLANEQH